jgi:hypothetical protein
MTVTTGSICKNGDNVSEDDTILWIKSPRPLYLLPTVSKESVNLEQTNSLLFIAFVEELLFKLVTVFINWKRRHDC